MSLAWAAVIDTLLRVAETWPERAAIERICVVRDLHGRIRIAARPAPSAAPDASAFEKSLASSLGAWFAAPILWTHLGSQEERRLAQNVLDRFKDTPFKDRWPASWPTEWDDGLGQRRPASQDMWCGEQRTRSKDAWLHLGEVVPPWPLLLNNPAIVSFYSFKGGVGRSTALGIIARTLAREGRRVVAIDLDLEAPGLGRLFDVETERGVLDLLAEHAATGTIDADKKNLELHHRALDEGKGGIIVYPVGAMDWSYIERLACLDYAARAGAQESSVEASIRAVLKVIRAQHQPDYMFLDARAGLHDLGGLSLHALSHVDVLIGRSGPATLDGFNLALHTLSRRRRREDLRVVIAQSFVPLPLEDDDHRRARDAWALKIYERFEATVYRRLYIDENEDLPGVADDTAMHYPWPIPQYDSIARVDRIQDIDEAVQRAEPFADLCARIVERCGRSPTGEVDEDEAEG